jgi:5'(3')-deoxyribonucleotidase
MARIAVDMDEVMADALGEHISRYNDLFGAQLSREHVVGRHLRDLIPSEHRVEAEKLVHCHEFFANLKVMPDAQEVLHNLSQRHEVIIATAAMEVPSSFTAKYEWLLEHFPFLSPMNFVFCGDKGVVLADYLIDDNPRQFRRFTGTGILFDAPHNRDITGFRRVMNWREVDQLFAGKENVRPNFSSDMVTGPVGALNMVPKP